MNLILEDLGLFSYNNLIRYRHSCYEETSYLQFQKNKFPFELNAVENDFFVKLSFSANEDYFIESWILHPYNINQNSCPSINIKTPNTLTSFNLEFITSKYNFPCGRLDIKLKGIELQEHIIHYLRSHFSSLFKNKVNIYFDRYSKIIKIDDYFNSKSGTKLVVLDDGFWFIPALPKESCLDEITSTLISLLNKYFLINMFAPK